MQDLEIAEGSRLVGLQSSSEIAHVFLERQPAEGLLAGDAIFRRVRLRVLGERVIRHGLYVLAGSLVHLVEGVDHDLVGATAAGDDVPGGLRVGGRDVVWAGATVEAIERRVVLRPIGQNVRTSIALDGVGLGGTR